MKVSRLLTVGAAAAGLLVFAASGAEARQRVSIAGGPRSWPHGHHRGMHGGHGFFLPFFVGERETVIIEREVIREVPVVVEPPPPPPPPRKPYKIGASYASLPPQGCMKLIEDGGSYYLCSGEWYRQVGSGSAATYKAVAKP